ncbi:hypothetical protein LCGC14_0415940 [marine sediment metagenome]|uniref:Uncharacterized protein n=1 Tax=marine sediment metagenome TaxID=412755 RepID=A0A0F9W1L8_9ZZZZ
MERPVRLCTKDGRKVGNAFCITWVARKPLKYEVETDFGNTLMVTEEEMLELWRIMNDEPLITYDQWKNSKETKQ